MDADPRFVRFEILALEKADFVGGHYWRCGRRRQIQRGLQIFFFLSAASALYFQIKAVGEQLLPFGQPSSGLLHAVI